MLLGVALAATNNGLTIISNINKYIVNPIIELMIAAAVVVFIYGVWEALGSDVTKKTDGNRHMVWGIVGLFVMVSAIGILNVVCSTIGCN
jgi:hypothetical protein